MSEATLNRTFEVLKVLSEKSSRLVGRALNRTFEVLKGGKDSQVMFELAYFESHL